MSQTIQEINRCFLRFESRAERITSKQIAETFVSVGPLMDLLSSNNNQIMYGRRGTGKTHALRYFQNLRASDGDIAIYVDAQNLGSNGSIYNDPSLPLSERATRLLIDVCSAIHHELLEVFTNPSSSWDLSKATEVLDKFVSGFSETRITGPTEQEGSTRGKQASKEAGGFNATLSKEPSVTISTSYEKLNEGEVTARNKVTGTEESWIDFGFFSQSIRLLASFIAPRRLWLLIDEWTTIPSEMQPYLADLIRRSMFSPNISVKIAAIEHRSKFKLDRSKSGYIGFELGADINAAINLDDYLVIDNDEHRAKSFFRTFLENHTSAVAEELKLTIDISSLITNAFTQDNVFVEFVRATEGVPRDAMHILALAAQKSIGAQLSMPVIRSAAHSFFQSDKYTAIQTNLENRLLLDWIRDEVIGNRRTRAFLLPVSTQDEIIDRLFDRRALHILNRSRSAAHRPGERFIVYKIDYGLYVDLVNTEKFPEGLLIADSAYLDVDFGVPSDDARSYRRAILDLGRFYDGHPTLKPSQHTLSSSTLA